MKPQGVNMEIWRMARLDISNQDKYSFIVNPKVNAKNQLQKCLWVYNVVSKNENFAQHNQDL